MNITLDEFLGDHDEILLDGRLAVVDEYDDKICLMLNDPPENYIFDFDAVGEFPNDVEKDRATFTTLSGTKVELSLIP